MRNIWTVFKREFWTYFNSPIAYVFIVVFLLILAILFFWVWHFYAMGRADMDSYFSIMPFGFAFFIAALAMRLWSEESKVGTLEVLLTLPLRTYQVTLGKFIAGYAVFAIFLGLTVFIPITVAVMGDPDWGPIKGGYVGALLLGGIFLALGCFISALTENQIVAFVCAAVAGIALCFAGFDWITAEVDNFLESIPVIGAVFEKLGEWIGYKVGDIIYMFGVTSHFENAQRGILDVRDFIYYVSMMVFFLFLSNFAVEYRRY